RRPRAARRLAFCTCPRPPRAHYTVYASSYRIPIQGRNSRPAAPAANCDPGSEFRSATLRLPPMSLPERLRSLSGDALRGMRRGIEKESLRVRPDGMLAQTLHPQALGATLTHPHI